MRLTFDDYFRVDPLLHCQTLNGTTSNSSWLSMQDYGKAVFFIDVGATDTTVDATVYQATDSSGTGAKAVSNASITQIGATDDNRLVSIEVDVNGLDIANGFDHVQLRITVGSGTTGANLAAWALRYPAGSVPVSQPTDYAEQVTVY